MASCHAPMSHGSYRRESGDAGSFCGRRHIVVIQVKRRRVIYLRALGLAGMGWIMTFARGAEGTPSDAPPKERLVSPRVAALLAAAVAKIELAKPAPGMTEKAKDEKAADAPVVMAPVHVTESAQKRRLEERVAQQQDAPKPPGFTLKDGGTILEKGPYELKFKYNAEHKGFDILNLKF